ncbi:MAG: hypothetical protein ACQETE_09335 [Bacteroidota bacterium]
MKKWALLLVSIILLVLLYVSLTSNKYDYYYSSDHKNVITKVMLGDSVIYRIGYFEERDSLRGPYISPSNYNNHSIMVLNHLDSVVVYVMHGRLRLVNDEDNVKVVYLGGKNVNPIIRWDSLFSKYKYKGVIIIDGINYLYDEKSYTINY